MTIAVIPMFGRAEMLWHCLERLRLADKPDNLQILFKPDYGYDPEIVDVMRMFSFDRADVLTPKKHPFHPASKQSANVLSGLYHAHRDAWPDGIVHLIEDDVMIGPDHFIWHEKAHNESPLFAAISSANCNGGEVQATNQTAVLSSGTYRGIGASFRASVINRFIAPHIGTPYYNAPRQYIAKTFTPDPFMGSWVEQDGLIRRIQMRTHLAVGYAHEPQSFHAGWYGANRKGKRPKGTLTQRIDKVGQTIYNADAMQAAAERPEFYADSKPITFEA